MLTEFSAFNIFSWGIYLIYAACEWDKSMCSPVTLLLVERSPMIVQAKITRSPAFIRVLSETGKICIGGGA